jgi:hypothetical protein
MDLLTTLLTRTGRLKRDLDYHVVSYRGPWWLRPWWLRAAGRGSELRRANDLDLPATASKEGVPEGELPTPNCSDEQSAGRD